MNRDFDQMILYASMRKSQQTPSLKSMSEGKLNYQENRLSMTCHRHAGGKNMLLLDGLVECDNIFRKGLRKEFGTISAVNIKEIKDVNKNNRRTFNGWGLFVDILLDDEITKITCMWSLHNEHIIGHRRPMGMCIPTGFMTLDNKSSHPITSVLNALAVKETNDLVGMEVKIKRTSTSIRIAPVNKCEIPSPVPEVFLRGGGWIFADLFQFADIDAVVTKERLTDLIALYGPDPRVGQRVKDLWNDLLEISHLRMLNEMAEDQKLVIDLPEDDKSEEKGDGRDIVSFLDAVSAISDATIKALEKLEEEYPEGRSELERVENKIHKAILKINIDNVNLG